MRLVAFERVELIGGGVEHGGQLVVVGDRDGAVQAPFAQPALELA